MGRIGEPGAFEEAVENRPGPGEVRAYVCRLKDGAVRPAGKERVDSGPIEEPAAIGARLRVAIEGTAMLGPFFHTPPPDEKGKWAAWAVAWVALVLGVAVVLLSVVLPP